MSSKIVNAFVQSFATKKAREVENARAEYLTLLHRLAREDPSADDTHEKIAALLERVVRTPEDFARDVDELAGLVRLADAARELAPREAACAQARTAFAEARAELKKLVAEGEARLSALERAHDDAAAELAAAHAAREQLLDLLGDRKGHYARLDEVRAAVEAGATKDAEKLRAELDRVTSALFDLAAYDPFRSREAPP